MDEAFFRGEDEELFDGGRPSLEEIDDGIADMFHKRSEVRPCRFSLYPLVVENTKGEGQEFEKSVRALCEELPATWSTRPIFAVPAP